MRVIDHTGHQVGIITTVEALRMARAEGLDLVEVAPKEEPPVCRILDYGKWKYQQQKKEHSSRKKQQGQELKEVRLRPKTDKHDLAIKLNRARRFLADGAKVQLTMIFRGRERLHRDIGRAIFANIATDLEDAAKIEREARFEGRRMIMILAPKAKKPSGSSGKPKPPKPAKTPVSSSPPAESRPAESSDQES